MKEIRRKPAKPPYIQEELPITASHKHYLVVGHYYAPDENFKYFWSSSQIMWRDAK